MTNNAADMRNQIEGDRQLISPSKDQPRVSYDTVRAAYRCILGREPESENVLLWHQQRAKNLEDLLRTFVNSEEYRFKAARGSAELQASLLNLLAYFTPRKVIGHGKIRVGNKAGDGGYVMLDDFREIGGALSAGVGGDVSWDEEIANRGIDIYQFDHTVSGPPVSHERFHFLRREIAPEATQNSESIRSLAAKFSTLEGRLIFKIDIEGSEWQVLDAAEIGAFSRVSQLVCEFHDFSSALNADWLARAARVLNKLNTAFQVVHVHANNWSPFRIIANVPVPEVIEVSFVNRSMYEFEETSEVYPTVLDRPNAEHRPDIFLGSMRMGNFCPLPGAHCASFADG